MTNHGGPRSAGIVGGGVIGRVHLTVQSSLPGLRTCFVVDPVRPPSEALGTVPWFASLDDALVREGAPDLLVLATPTATHLGLAAEVLRRTPRTLVLSEKPLTSDLERLRAFEAVHAADLHRLRVVNHFGFSPEVRWARDLVRDRGWEPPQTVVSDFHDPYEAFPPERKASYVSSWIDSGANQLLLLADFVDGLTIREHHVAGAGSRSVTQLEYRGGRAALANNWCTGASSKKTAMRWQDGRELHLDHTSMTGLLLRETTVEQHLGNDGTVGRKTAHYRAMYDALLASPDDVRLSVERARTVAELLASAAGRAAGNSVEWSTATW